MTQAEQHQLEDADRRREVLPGLAPLGRRLRSQDQQPAGLDGPVRPAPGARAEDAPQDPDPLRHRRRARPQQRAGRRRLPAQHRPRARPATPQLVEEIGRVTAAGGAGHRHPVDVRALRGRGARRALGPHLRGLLAKTPSWWPSWARRRCAGCRAPTCTIRCACWPAPSTSSGDGGTTYGTGTVAVEGAPGGSARWTRATRASAKRSCAACTCRATSRPSRPGVGSIMPSYSSWNGEQASGSKRLLTDILKDELGFEGFLISDYNAHRRAPGRLPGRRQAVDQRRHGHGDGAGASTGSSTRP